MITAKEARRRSMVNSKLKDVMDCMEEYVQDAIKRGDTSASMPTKGFTLEEEDAILSEFQRIGYVVKYDPPRPLPPGCPTDQWDFNGYLKLEWGGK